MDEISAKTIFKPYSIEDKENIRVLYFRKGDIKVWLQGEFYELSNYTLLEVNKVNKKVVNRDSFNFRSKSGTGLIYYAHQIKSFSGVKHHFDELFADEDCIVFKEFTEPLMDQIMEFHRYNAIDRCLEMKDYDTIIQLQQ